MPSPIQLRAYADLDLSDFDEIINVRAPVEFEEDHLVGAINLPVLDNEEREKIGHQYTQESSFEAQKAGAALVSAHISELLGSHFADKPRDYRPLVYCFRGGQRSRSLATFLSEIGWSVTLLEGGYKAYRQHVLRSLESLPPKFRFRVLNGYTGSGKTLVLQALEKAGAQVLDLEGLANHKGSVFGRELDREQPPQKRFETLLHDRLHRFDPAQTVFVEGESPKIGRINLPHILWQTMKDAAVTEIAAPIQARVAHLSRDYQPWIERPELVLETIDRLRNFQPAETIERWRRYATEAEWDSLVRELLLEHYDRFYKTDGSGYYRLPENREELSDHTENNIAVCVRRLMEVNATPSPPGENAA